MKKFRVLFMGTPDFAVPTLQSLIDGPDEVVAVVTNPDRPSGRGKKPTPPPVKVTAERAGIPVIQPKAVKTDAFRDQLAAYKPDITVVVAYGRILPQKLLDIPTIACINVHSSILPKLRGAAPINWAIVRGHTETGVSIMQMEAGLDTGPVYHIAKTPIEPGETAGELHDRLMGIGANALQKVLNDLREGPVEPQEQDHDNSTYAPMMKKSDGDIDWNQSAAQIAARIHGFNPWPGAWTTVATCTEPKLQGARLKLHRAEAWSGALPEDTPKDLPPGSVCCASQGNLVITTGDGLLRILKCQAPGRKALDAKNFLLGCALPVGTLLAHS